MVFTHNITDAGQFNLNLTKDPAVGSHFKAVCFNSAGGLTGNVVASSTDNATIIGPTIAKAGETLVAYKMGFSFWYTTIEYTQNFGATDVYVGDVQLQELSGTLPSAATYEGRVIRVSDDSSYGEVMAFSDGTNWIRTNDLEAVNSTGVIYSDSDNLRVGINTSTPSSTLEVSSAGDTRLRITDTRNASYSIGDPKGGIDFYWSDNSGNFPAVAASIEVLTGDIYGARSDLVFKTNLNSSDATEVMRLTSGGLLGLGTSTPTSSLTVVGETLSTTLKAQDGSEYTEILDYGLQANRDNWYIRPTSAFQDTANLIFGAAFGTTNQRWNVISYSFDNALYFTNGTQKRFEVLSGGDTIFYDNSGVEGMRWDASAQRLGIGTSSPATALDVAGTVTADGLSVDGDATISGAARNLIFVETDQVDKNTRIRQNGGNLTVATLSDDLSTATNRILISHSTGDISFYEDTGTTAKFYWDASAESLGIGTSSPDAKLDVYDSSTGLSATKDLTARFYRLDGTYYPRLEIRHSTAGSHINHTYSSAASNLMFEIANTERMRIDSSGNVGIGTASPNQLLSLNSNDGASLFGMSFDITGSERVKLQYINSSGRFVINNTTAGHTAFENNGSERMRIDSSGNLLVGTTDSTPFNNTTGNGVALGNFTYAGIQATNTSQNAGIFNRLSTDGEILQFRKDGTTVGSIGSRSGSFSYIDLAPTLAGLTGSSTGGGSILPSIGTTITDASISLGYSAGRFKNLYLSGVIYTNSDASINGLIVGKGSGGVASNTAVGAYALDANTTGLANTAIGYAPLTENTSGSYHTAVGYAALYVNTTGQRNSAFGTYSLHKNTTGNYNVGYGMYAGYTNETGSSNTSVGYYAGFSSTGSYNTFIGRNAGNACTTGSNNTIIGANAGSAGLSGTIILSAGVTERARCDSSGRWGLGTSSPSTELEVSGVIRASNSTNYSELKEWGVDINRATGYLRPTTGFSGTGNLQIGSSANLWNVVTIEMDNALQVKDGSNLKLQVQQSGDVIFYDSTGTEGMRWDASDNRLGIGVSAPTQALDLGAGSIAIDNQKGFVNSGAWTRNQTPHGYIDIGPANTSYAHIYTDRPEFYLNKEIKINGNQVWNAGNDGSGSGLDADTVDGLQASQFLRSDTSDTMSGNLTVTNDLTAGESYFGIAGSKVRINSSSTTGVVEFNSTNGVVRSNGSALVFDIGGSNIIEVRAGTIQPTTDNVTDLGSSSRRYDDVYATNSVIQTSDGNEKQDIEELTDAELRVAVKCKGLLRKFRFKSSVEEKGDEARIHFGIIAQDLQAAFESEGLDAGRYGMFVQGEDGKLGVRYSELLAFIIAAI